MSERASRNGSARVAPVPAEGPVSAPAAQSAESAAGRACIEALGRIAELHAELAAATRTFAENLERKLALRAEPSLMVNDVESPVMEPSMPELLLTAKQVAEMLRMHERTVRSRVRSGELPEPIRIGRSIRWRRETIENYIAKAEEQTR